MAGVISIPAENGVGKAYVRACNTTVNKIKLISCFSGTYVVICKRSIARSIVNYCNGTRHALCDYRSYSEVHYLEPKKLD